MSRDLVFEIGVEEMPSAALYDAIVQLKADTVAALDDARLGYAEIEVHGAPRRLVLQVSALADRQEDASQRFRGPAVRAAYDADGAPTKAAEGFARGRGVSVEDLVRETEAGGEYVYAVVESAGRAASEVLPELLADLVAGLAWPKSQRWGDGEARFIRPVRWMLALYGSEVVGVEFAGLTAGRSTWGHRFLSGGPIEVPDASEYPLAAERGKFMYDHEERARLIREGVESLAATAEASAVIPEKTFSEVVNLVEWPSVGVGRFDSEFLRVPREVLETAMESHQRYFPLQGADGSLLDMFVVVHNGAADRGEAIVSGHERVIRARLSDAAFFYDEDLKVGMEAWVERLDVIVFHEKLGTLSAKVERVERLTGALAGLVGAGPDEAVFAKRAAHLCKADLVSHVVVEFPSLQGVMGRYYSIAGGEEGAVAEAVVEHYRPRFAGDTLPGTLPGMLVSAADKLDTICGIFSIGAAPTGSADPYALRRAAIGVLAMLLEGGLSFSLDDAIAAALDGYSGTVASLDRETTGAAVKEFVTGRLESILKDRGHAYDTVEAVLAAPGVANDPSDALARCEALTSFRRSEAATDLLIACKRAANLADPGRGSDADVSLMGDAEKALHAAVASARADIDAPMRERRYDDALGALAALRGPIDEFFADVLVMDPDEGLRDNRLRLLNSFVGLFADFGDFGRLA